MLPAAFPAFVLPPFGPFAVIVKESPLLLILYSDQCVRFGVSLVCGALKEVAGFVGSGCVGSVFRLNACERSDEVGSDLLNYRQYSALRPELKKFHQ
jgi:hypothetical protein